MNWIEITAIFDRAPEDWSLVVDRVIDLGCENSQQIDLPPSLVVCVAEVEGSEERVAQIDQALREAGASDVVKRPAPDQDWLQLWKDHFKPRRIGERFWIVPSWDNQAGQPDDLVIELDPGQAFGTGDHPTTRLCLELLEVAGIEDKRVLDFGCGSGILSIGAKLLGASEIAGIDIEPLSVAIARDNAERNHVEIEFVAGDTIWALGRRDWDVVVSNIISATLIVASREVAQAIPAGGLWIVSGIITANWPDVLSAANSAGFCLDQERHEDGWVAATFVRI